MPRHLVATLFIGLLVSAVLIGLYQTNVFHHVGWWFHGLYQGTFLALEPGLLRPLQYGLILLLAYGSAWVAVDTPSAGGRGAITLLASLATVTLSPCLAFYGQLFEPASGVAAILLGIALGSVFANSEPGKRRHQLRVLLAGRADPSLIRKLSEAKHPQPLDSVARPVAALTCRIVNHGELANALSPEELAEMTRRFHALTSELLIGRGGILDADSPDCTRSYFGLIDSSNSQAPQDQPRSELAKSVADTDLSEGDSPDAPDPSSSPTEIPPAENFAEVAVDACHAALELAPHLHNLSRECETETGHRLVAGIGIECDTVTTCLVGEGAGQRLGAVGSVADFTLRLSAANATYGSDILVGPSAFQAARDAIEVRPMEMLYDPDSNHLAEIYELIDEKGFLSDDDNARRHAFWEGVVLLRQNLPEDALEKFARAKDGRRHDPPLAYFIAKAQTLRGEQAKGDSPSAPAPPHARNTASF